MNADAKVIVTPHAVERVKKRLSDFNPNGDATDLIYRDVKQALAAGRTSRNQPAWCRRPGGSRQKKPTRGEGVIRWCWTEDEQRAYALAWKRRRSGLRSDEGETRIWLVLTALARDGR